MIRLIPLQQDKIWGYERWIASTHPDGCQEEFLAAVGHDYPLLVKVIQADTALSVQVHPDDADAARLEGPGVRGKTECWYVLDAEPGARVVYGLQEGHSVDDLRAAVASGTLEACLSWAPVRRGDFIYIPAGTVHAMGGGMRLMEVQQSCNTTYRLYDWNRGRELHVEKALSVARNDGLLPVGQFPGSFGCPFFRLERRAVSGEGAVPAAPDWKLVYVISSGGGRLCSGGARMDLSAEDVVALSPGEGARVEGTADLMEISLPER